MNFEHRRRPSVSFAGGFLLGLAATFSLTGLLYTGSLIYAAADDIESKAVSAGCERHAAAMMESRSGGQPR